MSPSEEPTARTRIRDAALERFGRDGINRVTVRAIAAEAGVSPALVVHHFGTKEALRRECDAYVAATVRGAGSDPVDDAAAGDASGLLAMLEAATPTRRYLARALLDGSADAAALFDEIVGTVTAWLTEGEQQGWARPTEQPRTRAVLYVSWLLAPLVLDQHIARTLEVDDPLDIDATARFAPVMVDMLTHGVFTDASPLDAWDAARKERETQLREPSEKLSEESRKDEGKRARQGRRGGGR